MHRLQQANTASVAPSRGGSECDGRCEPKKSKSLRQLIDERLSQSQKKTMRMATPPAPTLISPGKTAKPDSSVMNPHAPVSKSAGISKSIVSARMQRRQQARQRHDSPITSCSSSAQVQRRQQEKPRHVSLSPSSSSATVTSYSFKVDAPNDHHSHTAATVCSSSSVSTCSIGTSIRVVAGSKRQQKENIKQHAPEHCRIATSRVGKQLSIPTTPALHSSFSPAIAVTSVSIPIATAVAQSRNQNHLMSRYSSSPQKQRPQRRKPNQDSHDENGQALPQRKQEPVFFDFEDNKIIPNPTTTAIIPRSHIKKPLAQDLTLKKKQSVLRKNTKTNTSQSPPLKKSQPKLEADSLTKSNKGKDIAISSSNSNRKNKIIIMPESINSSSNENKNMDDETTANKNMPQDGVGGGGRLSTPLARSRRFQSWCDSRKQKHAAYSSSGASLNPDE